MKVSKMGQLTFIIVTVYFNIACTAVIRVPNTVNKTKAQNVHIQQNKTCTFLFDHDDSTLAMATFKKTLLDESVSVVHIYLQQKRGDNLTLNSVLPDERKRNSLQQWVWLKQDMLYHTMTLPTDLDILTFTITKYDTRTIHIPWILSDPSGSECNLIYEMEAKHLVNFLWTNITQNITNSLLCHYSFDENSLTSRAIWWITTVWLGHDLECFSIDPLITGVYKSIKMTKNDITKILTVVLGVLGYMHPLLILIVETVQPKKNFELFRYYKDSTDLEKPYGVRRFLKKLFFSCWKNKNTRDKFYVKYAPIVRFYTVMTLFVVGMKLYKFKIDSTASVNNENYEPFPILHRYGIPEYYTFDQLPLSIVAVCLYFGLNVWVYIKYNETEDFIICIGKDIFCSFCSGRWGSKNGICHSKTCESTISDSSSEANICCSCDMKSSCRKWYDKLLCCIKKCCSKKAPQNKKHLKHRYFIGETSNSKSCSNVKCSLSSCRHKFCCSDSFDCSKTKIRCIPTRIVMNTDDDQENECFLNVGKKLVLRFTMLFCWQFWRFTFTYSTCSISLGTHYKRTNNDSCLMVIRCLICLFYNFIFGLSIFVINIVVNVIFCFLPALWFVIFIPLAHLQRGSKSFQSENINQGQSCCLNRTSKIQADINCNFKNEENVNNNKYMINLNSGDKENETSLNILGNFENGDNETEMNPKHQCEEKTRENRCITLDFLFCPPSIFKPIFIFVLWGLYTLSMREQVSNFVFSARSVTYTFIVGFTLSEHLLRMYLVVIVSFAYFVAYFTEFVDSYSILLKILYDINDKHIKLNERIHSQDTDDGENIQTDGLDEKLFNFIVNNFYTVKKRFFTLILKTILTFLFTVVTLQLLLQSNRFDHIKGLSDTISVLFILISPKLVSFFAQNRAEDEFNSQISEIETLYKKFFAKEQQHELDAEQYGGDVFYQSYKSCCCNWKFDDDISEEVNVCSYPCLLLKKSFCDCSSITADHREKFSLADIRSVEMQPFPLEQFERDGEITQQLCEHDGKQNDLKPEITVMRLREASSQDQDLQVYVDIH